MGEPALVRFSVIIPVYNRSSSVLPTLRSVQEQSHGDFECLVIDDGSEDGESLRELVEGMSDKRFKYIHRENGGGGAARNTGIEAASNEWVCFLDSDDLFCSNKLQLIADNISRKCSVDIWSHRAKVERDDNVSFVRPTRLPREGETITELMFIHREFLQTSTLTIRTALARKIMFNPSLRKAQDVDFLVRMERLGVNYRCLPDILSVWTDRPGADRIGSPRRPRDVRLWYEVQGPLLSLRLRRAFEATYLSYEIAHESPLVSFHYILRAFGSGAIDLRMATICLLRAFLSQRLYRILVNKLMVF